jgi:hypothetical protein
MSEPVTIQSTDYWIKVVEMLQQNWALIEAIKPEGVCVYFISDTSGVFDQMSFADEIAAREALVRNGFKRCADDLRLQSFLRPPPTPFHRSADPNGPFTRRDVSGDHDGCVAGRHRWRTSKKPIYGQATNRRLQACAHRCRDPA